jgi:DNA-binding CsgD family transcriptional regulator
MRTGPGQAEPDLVADLQFGLPVTRLEVDPLGPVDLEIAIRHHVGDALPLSVVREAVDVSAGSPLFAIEVARSLLMPRRQNRDDHVPLPSSLTELVGRHLRTLAAPTQQLLAAASALRKPSLTELRDLGVSESVADAERAGMIEIRGHEVGFAHPLYAAAAYDALSVAERMNLHARLALVVTGEEERARHLALGTQEPDEAVAAALDNARDRALSRGALHAALDACRLGLRATTYGSSALAGRLTEFGRLLYRVGDTTLAREQLTAAVDAADDPHVKARALHQLARLVSDTESEVAGAQFELQALELVGDDVNLAADIHIGLALTLAYDKRAAFEHAKTAVSLVEALPDVEPRRLAAALGAYVSAAFYSGEGADFQRCLLALELEAGTVDIPVSDRANSILGYLYMFTDDLANARVHLAIAHQMAVDESDEASRGYTLIILARVECRAGNWSLAEGHIKQCRELFRRSGNQYFKWLADQQQWWLDVHRGEYTAAIAAAETDINNGIATDNPLLEQRGRGLRGLCLLIQDDAAAAAVELDRYRELFSVNHADEPALRQLAGEHLEALVLAGRHEDAQTELDDLSAAATRLDRTAVLAVAARAEALLHAAQGENELALDAATRSIALFDRVERRFDRARALLTRGQIHRRLKHKALAALDLQEALDVFTTLEARPFASRTRDEINRIGMRRATPAGESESLTETEAKIAELTGRGLTSPEIAATLFLSPKTVSANLTRIYRKLGVRNRAELAARMAKPDSEV